MNGSVAEFLADGRPDLAVDRCLLALATFRGNMSAENRRYWTWLVVILDVCAARQCAEERGGE